MLENGTDQGEACTVCVSMHTRNGGAGMGEVGTCHEEPLQRAHGGWPYRVDRMEGRGGDRQVVVKGCPVLLGWKVGQAAAEGRQGCGGPAPPGWG